MTPEQEGKEAFKQKLSEDDCPYDGGQEEIKWKLGYAEQELHELRQEQASLLESMGFRSGSHTGLEEFIRKTEQKITQRNASLV